MHFAILWTGVAFLILESIWTITLYNEVIKILQPTIFNRRESLRLKFASVGFLHPDVSLRSPDDYSAVY